jgi:hypothetical protein
MTWIERVKELAWQQHQARRLATHPEVETWGLVRL